MKTKTLVLTVAALTFHSYATSSELSEKARCLALSNVAAAESCLRTHDSYTGRVGKGDKGENVLLNKPSRIQGDYAEYFGDDLSAIYSPLLIKALENKGEKLVVKVGAPDEKTGEYTIYLSATDDKSNANKGAILASNSGSESTGKHIVSWYNRSKVGDGYVFVSSLTHGLADLEAISRGGKYEAAFFELEKASPYGLLSAQYLYSLNEPGGDSRLYELAGETNRASVSITNWLNPSFKLKNQLSYTHRSQDFGAFNLSNEQQFLIYKPSVSYSNEHSFASLTLSKGISGSQDYNLIPLLGTFNPHFWSGQIDLSTSAKLPQDIALNASGSLFKGSIDMPSSERFRLGGNGAGSSHENGIHSGYKGYSYELVANKYLGKFYGFNVQSNIGLNGAHITNSTNHELSVDSLKVGLDLNYNKFTTKASFSKSVSTKLIEDDTRFGFDFFWHY